MRRLIVLAMTALVLACSIKTDSQAYDTIYYADNTLYEVEVTAYCDVGETKSGYVIPADGSMKKKIAAFAPCYIGKTVTIYLDDGEGGYDYLGIYEVVDTGSIEAGVREGKVIDIWMPTANQCYEFGRRKAVFFMNTGKG